MKKNIETKLGLAIILTIFLGAIFAIWAYSVDRATQPYTPVQIKFFQQESSKADELCSLSTVTCDTEADAMWRIVTAYNVGDPAQTDDSPCIGATGQDLCAALEQGIKVVATNELPLYSKVSINGEVYTVLDRTNSRYHYRYDIAFPLQQMQESRAWGRKTLKIDVL